MSAHGSLFTDAQRGSFGVCVTQLEELVQALRGYGVASTRLDAIGAAIKELESATAAQRPRVPANRIGAALAQMLVLEEEMRPRRMAAYGEITPSAARILDEHVQRLVDLTTELIGELERA